MANARHRVIANTWFSFWSFAVRQPHRLSAVARHFCAVGTYADDHRKPRQGEIAFGFILQPNHHFAERPTFQMIERRTQILEGVELSITAVMPFSPMARSMTSNARGFRPRCRG